jgi:hypothetical protein
MVGTEDSALPDLQFQASTARGIPVGDLQVCERNA